MYEASDLNLLMAHSAIFYKTSQFSVIEFFMTIVKSLNEYFS